jgi:hypothetical protein
MLAYSIYIIGSRKFLPDEAKVNAKPQEMPSKMPSCILLIAKQVQLLLLLHLLLLLPPPLPPSLPLPLLLLQLELARQSIFMVASTSTSTMRRKEDFLMKCSLNQSFMLEKWWQAMRNFFTTQPIT